MSGDFKYEFHGPSYDNLLRLTVGGQGWIYYYAIVTRDIVYYLVMGELTIMFNRDNNLNSSALTLLRFSSILLSASSTSIVSIPLSTSVTFIDCDFSEVYISASALFELLSSTDMASKRGDENIKNVVGFSHQPF